MPVTEEEVIAALLAIESECLSEVGTDQDSLSGESPIVTAAAKKYSADWWARKSQEIAKLVKETQSTLMMNFEPSTYLATGIVTGFVLCRHLGEKEILEGMMPKGDEPE